MIQSNLLLLRSSWPGILPHLNTPHLTTITTTTAATTGPSCHAASPPPPTPPPQPPPHPQVELSAERNRHTEEMQQVQMALDEATTANKERLQVIGGSGGGLPGSTSASASGSASGSTSASGTTAALQPSASAGSSAKADSDELFAADDAMASGGEIDYDQARTPDLRVVLLSRALVVPPMPVAEAPPGGCRDRREDPRRRRCGQTLELARPSAWRGGVESCAVSRRRGAGVGGGVRGAVGRWACGGHSAHGGGMAGCARTHTYIHADGAGHARMHASMHRGWA